MYLLDTNIAIHLRDGLESVLAKISEHGDAVALSTNAVCSDALATFGTIS